MGDGPPTLGDLAHGKLAHEKAAPETPAPLDPYTIGTQSLQAQVDMAPKVYQANAQYAPLYTALNNQQLSQSLFGSGTSPGILGMYAQATPQLGSIDAAANTQQRTADIADVAKLGGQATAAYNAANPLLTQSMTNLSSAVTAAGKTKTPQLKVGNAKVSNLGRATAATTTDTQAALAGVTDAYAQNASGGRLLGQMNRDASSALNSVSPIQQQLNTQAQQMLDQGGALSAQDLRTAQQTARSAAAARGIYDSNSAISAEVLNTDAMQRQRLLQNQTQAAAINAQGQQEIAANRGYAQGVQAQGQNLSQFNTGQQNQTGLANAQFANNTSLANAQTLTGAYQFNAGQANAASMANAQAQNQFALANQGTQADLAKFNSGQSYQTQLANAGLTTQAQQQNIANLSSLSGMYASQAQDPFQMVLGRSAAPGQAASATQQAQGTASSTNMFDPFASSIMNIYAGNQANQTAAATAAANNQSAQSGSMMGGAASIGAAAIIAL